MHITSTRGAYTVGHEGHTYEPVQGFLFELPQPLAEHLLGMSDAHGHLWRLPEADDYDLPEQIASPVKDGKPAKRTAPRQSTRPAMQGVPGPDVAGQ